ncbi:peptidoglycan DD-metalloendopeptidase family protein [bacterium]|nr:peptidoglycan DD-metalloendopeptidase family protein [bacterium]MBU1884490.1 peptidoglycan DD-metalloendopeptidase family protein [bacterium]
MRLFLSFYIIFLPLFANVASIDKKIKNTTSAINSKKDEYSSIHYKIEQNAQKILKQQKEIKKQQERLKDLELELVIKEDIYKTNLSQLQNLSTTQKTLKKDQEDIEQKLIFNIARMASLAILMDKKEASSVDSIMSEEVIKILAKQTDMDIKDLNNRFFKNNEYMASLEKKSDQIKSEIASIDQKRTELKQTKQDNENELVALNENTKKYKTDLETIFKQQDSLKQTLANLNIIKIDEIKRAKEKEQQEQAMNQPDLTNMPKVKKVGSSYQSVKTIRYRGSKTISPLEGYTVTKKYGNYTDPIYNIKIFNESVSLSPKEKDAKVRNVFNGKVIFAKNTPLLDNVVIVEHDNGLHTIYANLSQIAPDIQKGKKIRKSSVIGRVNDELVFEVTQKDYHINPLELF